MNLKKISQICLVLSLISFAGIRAWGCLNISGIYQREGMPLLIQYQQKACEEITVTYPSGNFIKEPITFKTHGQLHWVYDSYKSYKFYQDHLYINAFYQKQGVVYEGRVYPQPNGDLEWRGKWIDKEGKIIERTHREIFIEKGEDHVEDGNK